MPKAVAKTKIEPEYPEMNWLRAAIYDRKKTMNLSWDQIGAAVGTTGDALKHLMHNHPDPWDWPRYTLKKICRVLGIEIRMFVVGSPEDPCQ